MIMINTDEQQTVNAYHYSPFDPVYGLGKTKEELELEGNAFVESIPEPQAKTSKVPLLKYSKEKGLHYEYQEVNPLNESEAAQILNKLAEANEKIGRLTVSDLDNKEMIATLYELTMMGGIF